MESKNNSSSDVDRTEPLDANHEELRKLYFSNIKKDVTADELKQWIADQVPTLSTENVLAVDLPEGGPKNDKPIKIAFATIDSVVNCDLIVAAVSKLKDDAAKFKGNTVNMKRAVPKALNNAEESFRVRTSKMFIANVQKEGDIEKDLKAFIFEHAPDAKDEESRGEGEQPGPLGGVKKFVLIKEKEKEGKDGKPGGLKMNENKGYGFLECDTPELADKLAIQFYQFMWSANGVEKRKIQLKKSMKDGDMGLQRRGGKAGQMRGAAHMGGYGGGYAQQQHYGAPYGHAGYGAPYGGQYPGYGPPAGYGQYGYGQSGGYGGW